MIVKEKAADTFPFDSASYTLIAQLVCVLLGVSLLISAPVRIHSETGLLFKGSTEVLP